MNQSQKHFGISVVILLIFLACIAMISAGIKYDRAKQAADRQQFKQQIIDSVQNSMYEPLDDNGDITRANNN